MQNTKSQPKLRLYGFADYDRSAMARWILTHVGATFENQWIDSSKKEHEGPAFLKINPMGRIPVLQIDDQFIAESGAISLYLGDLFSDRGISFPIGSPERAKYLQWIFFSTATLDFFQTRMMIIEDIPAGDVQTAKLTSLQSDLRDALGTLDLALAQDSFLVGNRFSVADICVSYNLFWCTLWPELKPIYSDFPRVWSYFERMKAMPSAVESKVFSYEG